MSDLFNKQSFMIACLIVAMAFIFVSPSHAEPEQRIVISFDPAVTDKNKIKIHQDLKAQLNNDYSLAQHSDNNRWIVILHSPVDQQRFTLIKNSLLSNSYVKYVEMDKLLERTSTINVQ